MKKSTIAIIAVVVILLFMLIGGYNSIISEQTAVEEQTANINTQLQRRSDLIPNLVNTVKGYAAHETAVFEAVTKARENMLAAGSMEEKAAANEEMTSALGRLLAIAESYPDLKSDSLYVQLMDELSGTENRIAYAREEYNAAVSTYNKSIRTFPGSLYAGMFGFEKADFFEAAAGAEQVPEVDLS